MGTKWHLFSFLLDTKYLCVGDLFVLMNLSVRPVKRVVLEWIIILFYKYFWNKLCETYPCPGSRDTERVIIQLHLLLSWKLYFTDLWEDQLINYDLNVKKEHAAHMRMHTHTHTTQRKTFSGTRVELREERTMQWSSGQSSLTCFRNPKEHT